MPSPSPYALIALPNQNRAASFRHAVSDTLRIEATLVRDGDDALREMARRGLPSLLIVDLSLPRVDGFAVIRKARRQGSASDMRVIVVAAHESLLAAARELSGTLAISGVLPIDIDDESLRNVLAGERRPSTPAAAGVPAAPSGVRDTLYADADAVMDRTAIEVRRRFHMPISVGYLRIADEENFTFQAAAHDGSAIPRIEMLDFTFLKQVADAENPLVIPHVEDHPLFSKYLSKGATPIRGFAAVPVVAARAEVRGALSVLDIKPLTLGANDLDALAAFGRNVGQEIDRVLSPGADRSTGPADANIEDVKALQHLAATDPLTGLANRRGGEKHIASEISRAKRERRALSCILLDIDRFKQVNDTYGHQAGDQLLRDISALLRKTVRTYDILVRWGGEEFLLVLPGVDIDAARALADRVRAAVACLDTHGIGPVTISAGAAKFDADYDFAATLRTADQRLYQAKASGRNAVV